jgi:hypothetical protein
LWNCLPGSGNWKGPAGHSLAFPLLAQDGVEKTGQEIEIAVGIAVDILVDVLVAERLALATHDANGQDQGGKGNLKNIFKSNKTIFLTSGNRREIHV